MEFVAEVSVIVFVRAFVPLLRIKGLVCEVKIVGRGQFVPGRLRLVLATTSYVRPGKVTKEKVNPLVEKPLVAVPLVPARTREGRPVSEASLGLDPSRYSRRLLTPSPSKSPLAVRAGPVIPY